MELGRSVITEAEFCIISVSVRIPHTSQQRSQTGTVGFIYKCFSCDVSHSTIGNVCTDTQVGIYPLLLNLIARRSKRFIGYSKKPADIVFTECLVVIQQKLAINKVSRMIPVTGPIVSIFHWTWFGSLFIQVIGYAQIAGRTHVVYHIRTQHSTQLQSVNKPEFSIDISVQIIVTILVTATSFQCSQWVKFSQYII